MCLAVAKRSGGHVQARFDAACRRRPCIQLFGSMETLVVDGEGGATSAYFVEEMERRGVQVDTRAPRQHARF
eukprot:8882963-Pyramimonas_sp.AAC.1